MLRNSFLLMSTACFATAYSVSGHWPIAAVLLLCPLFWFLLRGQSVLWRSSCLLTASVVLAAVGVMLDVSAALMAVAITAALAAWDLVNFDETLKLSLIPEVRKSLVQSHLRSLFMAVATGMLLALSASLVRLELPFAATGALALVLIAALMSAAPRMLGLDR